MLIEYVGLQLPKYIKHAFYKMQIHHHHRHALLHRNALQQTCNNEGWGLSQIILSFLQLLISVA